MRSLVSIVAFGFALLVAGVDARADVHSLTNGSLTLPIGTLQPPLSVPQTTTVAPLVTRNAGQLANLQFAQTILSTQGFVLPVTDPAAAPIKGIQATAKNAAANFQANADGQGHFGGVMPLVGQNKVCLFAPCSIAVANINVPVSVVGVGGTVSVSAAVNLTVVGAPWTTATAAIGSITQMGGLVHTQMGTANTDNVTLVTPVFVSTNIGPSAVVPVFGIFNFKVTSSAPEPATVGVFGAVAALVGLGVARRKKRS